MNETIQQKKAEKDRSMGAESVLPVDSGTESIVSMKSTNTTSAINMSVTKGRRSIFNGTRDSTHTESTSGSGASSASGFKSKNKSKINRIIKLGRIFLVAALLVSAALFGFFSYFLMQIAESRLAKNRFRSIVLRAQANAKWVIAQKTQASRSLAKMYGLVNPDASKWPFVYMEGFQDIASTLDFITKGSLSFCPIVTGFGENSEQKKFEDYYYNLYEEWGYPNGTAESSFGKGIFGFGFDVSNSQQWPDGRYPVLSNNTYHGTPNPENLIVPFVQSNFGNHSALMVDTLYEYNRFVASKKVMDCAEKRKILQDSSIDCDTVTDMLWQPTNAKDVTSGPSAILYTPIYPRNDPFQVSKTCRR